MNCTNKRTIKYENVYFVIIPKAKYNVLHLMVMSLPRNTLPLKYHQ